uniref:Uma2 family endonuclease n=1 Tax=Prochlorothrix hollandica TaxID=1223 RepID=UPI00333FE7F9
RLKYKSGEILLMSPLPRHGREAHLLARIVELLLESQNRNYEGFTPITMRDPQVGGIEPDYCFYIDNWQAAAGKDRIDWQTEPPPDLVIEIDVSSYTDVADYAPYGVPEVWIFRRSGLAIYQLQGSGYEPAIASRFFPDVKLGAIVTDTLDRAAIDGSGTALRHLRQSLTP